ncbi:hypothetical protein CUMW_044590 [Citrus unshiu]|nr:hypothetical protein CUMW_044590 [Citrus unshiu]
MKVSIVNGSAKEMKLSKGAGVAGDGPPTLSQHKYHCNSVSEKILDGRKLEVYRWEGDPEEMLKDVREKLNMLGEHWTRDQKNKSLKEAAKSFKFLGQIMMSGCFFSCSEAAYSSFGPAQQSSSWCPAYQIIRTSGKRTFSIHGTKSMVAARMEAAFALLRFHT